MQIGLHISDNVAPADADGGFGELKNFLPPRCDPPHFAVLSKE